MVRASRGLHHGQVRYEYVCSGNFFVDDAVLKAKGISDFSGYAVDANAELMPDFFV